MSVLNNSLLLGADAGAGGYTISRSLRFNAPDSAYLSRTPASAGNRRTWTWAGWVKRSELGTNQVLFDCRPVLSDSQFTVFYLKDSNTLELSGPVTTWRTTTQLFRDASAWYHIVLALDTTQSTASSRIKIYVNGVQVTAFATSADPSQNADLGINQSSLHGIGASSGGSPAGFLNGYLADIHFIDGQALTPTSFGEFSATTGVWMPKQFAGSYGSQGWKLSFSDNSTAAALGTDTSGAGNTWTVNNLSVAAGAGNDSLVDVPTNGSEVDTGIGGEVRGNYCTLNPLDNGTGKTYSNGNLEVSDPGSGANNSYGTTAVSSGKWYWEVRSGGVQGEQIGFADANAASGRSSFAANGWTYEQAGRKVNNNSYTSYGSSYANGDIIGIALNMDVGEVTFYKNGVSQGVAFSGLSGKAIQPMVERGSGFGMSWVCNFGQRPFAYTAPSGFKALNTANLPAPVVTKPSTAMDVKLWTGNGSSQTITTDFSPDFVWIKRRDAGANYHILTDTVRGSNKQLFSNDTIAEESRTDRITAFNSDGFTLGSYVDVNNSTYTYAGWCWDAGSSTVTNTQGSISSQVRANASAGFSICTFTTQSSGSGTFGHGLGIAPSLVITKLRDATGGWLTYHASLGATKYVFLHTTDAEQTNSGAFNNTAPTSTLVTLGSFWATSNTAVSYCFAPVVGYSSFGSYTGNGSADGPFVYTGFRPRFVMLKGSSFVSNWHILDAARNAYNVTDSFLRPNLSSQEFNGITEGAGSAIDILSNGFKLRASFADSNTNAASFVWAAFAESPFQYARAR